MFNYLLAADLQEKIKWYIRAREHNIIGSLNYVLTFFENSDNSELSSIIREITYMLKNIGANRKIKDEVNIIDANVKSIEYIISKQDLEDSKRVELLIALLGVKNNIARIKEIINSPRYTERFRMTKIVFTTLLEVVEDYPDVLYGDIVGHTGQFVGNKIKFSFIHKGPDLEYNICGYEISRMFYSLMSNSIKKSEYKGKVVLLLKTTPNSIRIGIQDSNISMTETDFRNFKESKSFPLINKDIFNDIQEVIGMYNGLLDINYKSDEDPIIVINLPIKSVN